MKTAPTGGYILNGLRIHYRSTALAEMKRINAKEIKNIDGKIYTIQQIEYSIINYRK